jgi:hypothetical protein
MTDEEYKNYWETKHRRENALSARMLRRVIPWRSIKPIVVYLFPKPVARRIWFKYWEWAGFKMYEFDDPEYQATEKGLAEYHKRHGTYARLHQ